MKKLNVLLISLVLQLSAMAQNVEPEYTISGKDSTCQIFIYSPGEKDGLHLAYLGENEKWNDVGQLCSSDYGQWGAEKKMHNPFVIKAKDGTWRAVWGINNTAPTFAAAFSENLITWRPQDYPVVAECGVNNPIVYQMDDGGFDIYLKTAKGKRYLHASEDFRHFEEDSVESEADDVLWQMDIDSVNGKLYLGNEFEIPAFHLNYIRNWFNTLDKDNLRYSEKMADDGKCFPNIGDCVNATIDIDFTKTKKISNKLIGVFFEDINYAADGGLYAELLRNKDFEYTDKDHVGWNASTGWKSDQPIVISTDKSLSKNNLHYAIINKSSLINSGWDNIISSKGNNFDFSMYARCIDDRKNQLIISLVDSLGNSIAEGKIKIEGNEWIKYNLNLILDTKKHKEYVDKLHNLTLIITGKNQGQIAVDMISLFPHQTFKGHGMRIDLAQTIANLKPKFVRFPGGCMLHGDGLDNIYNWKETIGPLQDRKPERNIWNYHQSRGLGYYEYFQFCEDIGAEPLPVMAAGVPCQNSSANTKGIGGQQCGIPVDRMPEYIQDVLDMIEWANGDPATSKWAKMRQEAGHPAPFNLKMIGIGNEDLISTVFEERYLMICKAVKVKYPNMEVVGTVGPFHNPSSDYIEGWKFANQNKKYIDAVDEHYYESTGWFLHNTDYYDSYDRNAPKVYLGEYASHTRTMESALAEAIYLCNVERNADVVEMASYAPLLCNDKHKNWNPDLIYFDETNIVTTPSYETQVLFSNYSGDKYISSKINIDEKYAYRVASSVVRDETKGKTYLKLVNALPTKVCLKVNGINLSSNTKYMMFGGRPESKTTERILNDTNNTSSALIINNNIIQLPAYSVVGIEL
jgi:Alpha-L-arabinofuranosidase